jgi:hypothetical protein
MAQYTKYNGPSGIEVTLIRNPMYDSEVFCKQSHPLYPGKPIDSARMTILDFGSSEGKNNVSMLRVKNSFVHGYTQGK